MDNIVIFEVHWRKMIVDIREGKLNRRLPIDDSQRGRLESHMLPTPENAERLDRLFRDLGFHKKVVGKEIPSIQLVERRDIIGALGESDDHSKSAFDCATPDLEQTSCAFETRSEDEEVTPRSLILGDRLETISSTSSATHSFREQSNKSVKKAAEKAESPAPIELGGAKFACPYAGCGRTFNSHLSALAHIIDHEKDLMTTVEVPAPRTDAHFEFFWPRDAAWVPRSKNFVDRRLLPPDTVFCPHKGCDAYFANERQLLLHVKMKHPRSKLNRTFKGDYFTLMNTIDPPPLDTLGLYICKEHVDKPSRRCRACQEIEGKNFPKPPYLFYESLSVNFPLNEERDASITERFISFTRADHEKAMKFIDKKGSSVRTIRGLCREFVLDRNKKCWVYILELISHDEAVKRKIHLPRDFDAAHELFPSTQSCVWIALDLAVQDLSVEYCSKSEFKLLTAGHGAPPKYFVRPEYRIRLP